MLLHIAQVFSLPLGSESSASQMNMKLIHKYIVSNLSEHWGALSDFLEYPTAVKKTFSRPNPRDSMKLLLEDWISTDNGRKPKTWEVFIEVLNELGEAEGQPVLNITRWIVQCLLQEGVIKSESSILHTLFIVYVMYIL